MITGTTRVVAVIGDPVAHSLSPAFQNAALRAMGLDWVYVPFRVPATLLPQALAGLGSLGVVGSNVTIPHKEAVAGYVDELDPFAAWVGAVNTLRWQVRAAGEPPVLQGFNTDGPGFLAALHEETGYNPGGGRVVLLGAGGAARAIAGQLRLAGVERLTLVNRTLSRAQALAEWLRAPLPPTLEKERQGRGGEPPVVIEAFPWPELAGQGEALERSSTAALVQQRLAEADLLVQATSYGMAPLVTPVSPLPPAWLHPGLTVYDIVYRPAVTALLAAASSLPGVRWANGEGMLIHQGALSLRLWSGTEPPLDVMRQALRQALQVR